MSQFEAFATLKKPPVQLANLTVGTSAQSVIFDLSAADRNGTTALGSPVITSIANTQGIVPGMRVASANIPAGSVVLSVVPNTSITISQNATAAGAVNHQFAQGSSSQIARVRINNLSSTATVAINFSDILVTSVPAVQSTVGTASTARPTYVLATMVASASGAIAAGDGIRIQPGTTLELNLSLDTRIWLIASAASTPVQVACILQNG